MFLSLSSYFESFKSAVVQIKPVNYPKQFFNAFNLQEAEIQKEFHNKH